MSISKLSCHLELTLCSETIAHLTILIDLLKYFFYLSIFDLVIWKLPKYLYKVELWKHLIFMHLYLRHFEAFENKREIT